MHSLLIFDTLEPKRFFSLLSGRIALRKLIVEFEEQPEKSSNKIIRLSKPGTIDIIMDPKSLGSRKLN